MFITFESSPLSDSHASDWKFSQINPSSQVSKAPRPKHKADSIPFQLDLRSMGTRHETLKQAQREKNNHLAPFPQ